MLGILEGLESCWNSPGLKVRQGNFDHFPQIGDCFTFDPYGPNFLCTSAVRSITIIENEYRFRTRNTTYILTVIE
jgi:hypothetical protein